MQSPGEQALVRQAQQSSLQNPPVDDNANLNHVVQYLRSQGAPINPQNITRAYPIVMEMMGSEMMRNQSQPSGPPTMSSTAPKPSMPAGPPENYRPTQRPSEMSAPGGPAMSAPEASAAPQLTDNQTEALPATDQATPTPPSDPMFMNPLLPILGYAAAQSASQGSTSVAPNGMEGEVLGRQTLPPPERSLSGRNATRQAPPSPDITMTPPRTDNALPPPQWNGPGSQAPGVSGPAAQANLPTNVGPSNQLIDRDTMAAASNLNVDSGDPIVGPGSGGSYSLDDYASPQGTTMINTPDGQNVQAIIIDTMGTGRVYVTETGHVINAQGEFLDAAMSAGLIQDLEASSDPIINSVARAIKGAF